MTKQALMAAVRKFRESLNMTQSDFAHMLGRGCSTIQRYEQVVPPKGKALAQMMQLAHAHGLYELSQLFQLHLASELDFWTYPHIHDPSDIFAILPPGLLTPEDQRLHDALTKVQRSPLHKHVLEQVEMALKPFMVEQSEKVNESDTKPSTKRAERKRK